MQIGNARMIGGETEIRGTPRQFHIWAHRAAWPCSELCRYGKTIWARFNVNGELVDGNVPEFCHDEFDAWVSDVLSATFGPTHPAIRS